jgi:hypothetical protein
VSRGERWDGSSTKQFKNFILIIEGAFKREDENGIKNKLSFVYVVKSRKISFITFNKPFSYY